MTTTALTMTSFATWRSWTQRTWVMTVTWDRSCRWTKFSSKTLFMTNFLFKSCRMLTFHTVFNPSVWTSSGLNIVLNFHKTWKCLCLCAEKCKNLQGNVPRTCWGSSSNRKLSGCFELTWWDVLSLPVRLRGSGGQVVGAGESEQDAEPQQAEALQDHQSVS